MNHHTYYGTDTAPVDPGRAAYQNGYEYCANKYPNGQVDDAPYVCGDWRWALWRAGFRDCWDRIQIHEKRASFARGWKLW